MIMSEEGRKLRGGEIDPQNVDKLAWSVRESISLAWKGKNFMPSLSQTGRLIAKHAEKARNRIFTEKLNGKIIHRLEN